MLFVYGTLMRGYALHRMLAGAATFLGEGSVSGTLLDLGPYPGLVDTDAAPYPRHATLGESRSHRIRYSESRPRPSRYSKSRPRRTRYNIRGELYRLRDRELLHALDREEGYNFERRRAGVRLAHGRRSRAWVYRYRGARDRAVLIPHGDYRRAHPRPARQ